MTEVLQEVRTDVVVVAASIQGRKNPVELLVLCP
jgi:hypothetical protein